MTSLARYRLTPELGNLSNLENLIIAWTKLTGMIPSELGNLSKLKVAHLDTNGLTGEIPSQLGNLKELEKLTLQRNKLTGALPLQLGDASKLAELYLDYNNLNGEIPFELSNLSNLESLYLRGNKFTGCAPGPLLRVERNDLSELNLCYGMLSPLPTTVNFPADGSEWFKFEVDANVQIYVEANPKGSDRVMSLVGYDAGGVNKCTLMPKSMSKMIQKNDGEYAYLAGCEAGTGVVEIRRSPDDNLLDRYTIPIGATPTPTLLPTTTGPHQLRWDALPAVPSPVATATPTPTPTPVPTRSGNQ